jgi:IS5 family transposase
MLTGGNVADCKAGAELLARLPPCEILHGDKGYDSDAIRRQVESDGAMPNIPPKIAVGTLIAKRPPRRSVLAEFPHTAPTSGV